MRVNMTAQGEPTPAPRLRKGIGRRRPVSPAGSTNVTLDTGLERLGR
jgi:hypothetical protein